MSKKGVKSKIFVRLMAGILAAMMVLSVGVTLLYYLISM